MKAALLEHLHQPLHYTEVPTPSCRPREVRVALKAASLNHRDVWIQKGLYPNIKTPLIPGADGAGAVVEVGEGVADHWLGQEVVINPSHNWGNHPGYYGEDYKILGLPDPGTFAEFVTVEARYLAPKPRHLSFAQAAALPLAGLTAWRALMTRAAYQPGERVLVTGAGGGVALFVLQFAMAAGAEVWVSSGSDEKIQKAVALGARGGVNYKVPTWYRDLLVKAKAPKRGYFDVIIDGAGGPGFARLIDLAAPGGRICFYGGTAGHIMDVVPAKAFFKQLSILGTTMGTEEEFEAMLQFIEDKALEPVIDTTFTLREAEAALRRMDAGQQFGKIVLSIGD